MARMTKKISENIEKKQPPKETPKNKSTKWVVTLLIINLFLMLFSLPVLEEQPASFIPSVLLEIILIIIYINRKEKFTPQIRKNLLKIQFFCMAMLFLVFLFNIYLTYIR